MIQPLPVLALVGRPNVGKSTLFNRLTRTRDALVADRPGITRDRQYGFAEFEGQRFIVVDTGGIGQEDDHIDEQSSEQVDIALEEADIVLFVVDSQAGITASDELIAQKLRRLQKNVVVVANKSEGITRLEATAEFYALGLGEPWAISAERGDRMNLLLGFLLKEKLPENILAEPLDLPAADDGQIRLALLGRPNVGKSTLVNRFLGEERMLAMDKPGLTRDAISSVFEFDDEEWIIVDTAGIRRRARIRDYVERLTVIKSMQASEAADVVIILLDARQGLSTQDLRLLSLTQEQGKPAVIAVNKWDGLSHERRDEIREELLERFGSYDYLPLCFISAFHGSGLRELLDAARASYDAAATKMSTPALTKALEQFIAAHPPPIIQGRRVKLRFAHQGGEHPPTIVIHGNQTKKLPDEYKRYLIRRFRETFNLFGTPINLVLKTGDNPYAHRASKKPKGRQRRQKRR